MEIITKIFFSVVHNRRTGKSCAANIKLVSKAEKIDEEENAESSRPDRLKMQLNKQTSVETAVLRQPKGKCTF